MHSAARRGAGAVTLLAPGTLASPAATRPAATPASITFFVYYHSKDGPLVGIEGVRVSRVGSDGEAMLGTTDTAGRLIVGMTELRRPGSLALLFCGPKFAELCTAIRLDTDLLRGFEEWNVQLPPFELIDRVTIVPKRG